MPRLGLLTVALVAVLAVVAVAATWTVGAKLRTWADDDLTRRAALAVNGAREALESHQAVRDSPGMRKLLESLTRDERLLAAAFCSSDNQTLAMTSHFPTALDCPEARLVPQEGNGPFSGRVKLQTGPVHVSIVPLD